MPNYQNGKIYCIRSFKTDDIYIGSTTQPLCKRIDGHRQDYKQWINGSKKYCTSVELIKYGDAYIELIKPYPCNSKEELKREEGIYQREMDCVNKRKESRTPEEKKEYDKQWYEDNKEKIKQLQKEYRSIPEIKEKYKQYSRDYEKRDYVIQARKEKKEDPNIIKHKKEYMKKFSKEYYEKNKQKLHEKITCVCGSITSQHHTKRHERTQKHIQFIQSQN